MKKRDEKYEEYQAKFSHIPIDYNERLGFLYDKLNLSDRLSREILEKRDRMLTGIYFKQYQIVLFEEPEGSPRPRFRLINRKNAANMALAAQNFVHVYSPTGHSDSVFMKRLISEQEVVEYESLICTPCDITINTYHKTPVNLNKVDTFLAELGMHRPLSKPDWDNIEKKYSDMFNANVWLDDTLVVDGAIHKYYSILPRVEIFLNYMNCVYTKQQYDRIINRVDFPKDAVIDYIK